jgi:exonuclease III
MDNINKQNWKVLNWNIHGLNTTEKYNAVRSKVEESDCSIFCIQETKMQVIEHSYLRKLAPKRFNKFAFTPFDGASGEILMGWNTTTFEGEVLYTSKFAITVKFTARHNAKIWNLSIVYGPCQTNQRQYFVDWLNGLHIEDTENWMTIRDFNLYRSLENRNRQGDNM